MDPFGLISIGLGAAWASGLNLYATVLIFGGLHALGIIELPPDLKVLSKPGVLITAAILYCLEFIADKVPGVDSVWDAVHSFIRIPAGALMAAGAVGGLENEFGYDVLTIAALIAGGALSGLTHATKSGVRVMANTSPEPVSNWFLSIFEDVLVVIGAVLAVAKPVVFVVLLALFLVLAIWLLPKVIRALRKLIGYLGDRVGEFRRDRRNQ